MKSNYFNTYAANRVMNDLNKDIEELEEFLSSLKKIRDQLRQLDVVSQVVDDCDINEEDRTKIKHTITNITSACEDFHNEFQHGDNKLYVAIATDEDDLTELDDYNDESPEEFIERFIKKTNDIIGSF